MITVNTQESASDLRTLRAAYRNRTDDLRITRSPAHRPGRATCTDGSTRVPECSQRTACSGFSGHDAGHDLAYRAVTECGGGCSGELPGQAILCRPTQHLP